MKPCCVSFSEGKGKLVPVTHIIGTVSAHLHTNTVIVLHLSAVRVFAAC